MWKAILAAAAAVGLLAACGEDVKAKATTPPAAQAAPAAAPAAEPAQAAPAAEEKKETAQAAPAAEEKKEAAEAKADKDKLPGEQNQ